MFSDIDALFLPRHESMIEGSEYHKGKKGAQGLIQLAKATSAIRLRSNP
jgi:hypothetical protein